MEPTPFYCSCIHTHTCKTSTLRYVFFRFCHYYTRTCYQLRLVRASLLTRLTFITLRTHSPLINEQTPKTPKTSRRLLNNHRSRYVHLVVQSNSIYPSLARPPFSSVGRLRLCARVCVGLSDTRSLKVSETVSSERAGKIKAAAARGVVQTKTRALVNSVGRNQTVLFDLERTLFEHIRGRRAELASNSCGPPAKQ